MRYMGYSLFLYKKEAPLSHRAMVSICLKVKAVRVIW
jgi:hypothetical protein